jgi:hypothetical protein
VNSGEMGTNAAGRMSCSFSQAAAPSRTLSVAVWVR